MAFRGEFQNTIDVKGRLSVPSELRDQLLKTYGDERLVITKGLKSGLLLYPHAEWEKILARFEADPPSARKSNMEIFMIAPAKEVTFDKQGRIQIGPTMRAYAKLEKESVILGRTDKIQIWSQSAYDEMMEKLLAELQGETEYVSGMGLD